MQRLALAVALAAAAAAAAAQDVCAPTVSVACPAACFCTTSTDCASDYVIADGTAGVDREGQLLAAQAVVLSETADSDCRSAVWRYLCTVQYPPCEDAGAPVVVEPTQSNYDVMVSVCEGDFTPAIEALLPARPGITVPNPINIFGGDQQPGSSVFDDCSPFAATQTHSESDPQSESETRSDSPAPPTASQVPVSQESAVPGSEAIDTLAELPSSRVGDIGPGLLALIIIYTFFLVACFFGRHHRLGMPIFAGGFVICFLVTLILVLSPKEDVRDLESNQDSDDRTDFSGVYRALIAAMFFLSLLIGCVGICYVHCAPQTLARKLEDNHRCEMYFAGNRA